MLQWNSFVIYRVFRRRPRSIRMLSSQKYIAVNATSAIATLAMQHVKGDSRCHFSL